MTAPPLLVREAILRSRSWLEEQNSATPRLDAELLLAHVLGCKRLDLFLHPDRPLSEEEVDEYRTLIRRRGALEPIPYITGEVGFWKHDFRIDSRALVPRPETEGILDVVLAAAGGQRNEALRIVDVGCGSGVLAVSLALEFPQAKVIAIDISKDALELTMENARLHGVDSQVHPLESHLLDRLIQHGSKADIIVSNPPYIAHEERPLMGAGVERWEPSIALFAENQGYALIDGLIQQLPQVLDQGGLFVMEFGSPQGQGIRERAQRRFRNWEVRQDYGGHDRLLVVNAPGTRSWFKAAAAKPPTFDGENLSNNVEEDSHHELNETLDNPKDSLLYGGADGTEKLPEIDLNEDLS